jgi:hypothetical protein
MIRYANAKWPQEILHGEDLHDTLFEFFVGDDGFVFDPCFVGVDGVDGIFEDAGDLLVLVDPLKRSSFSFLGLVLLTSVSEGRVAES